MLKALTLIVLLTSSQAFADLEIRAQIGTMPKEGGNLNSGIETAITPNPAINSITTLGGDVMVSIPLVPIAIGARYESISGSATGQATMSSNAVTAAPKISGARTLALLSFRPITSPLGYIGLIGHYALSKSLKYSEKVTNNGSGATTDYNFSGNMPASYGGGIEAGLTLGSFVLGIEGGYTMFKTTNMTESSGLVTNMGGPNLDLSGIYMRASIGLSFF